jgi:UDP-glucose 4-epimerase
LNKPKILVTGANGLLGRHAIQSLRDEYEVYAATHMMPIEPVEHVIYVMLDLSTQWSVDSLPSDLDVIIHLAQSSRFREFPEQSPNIFNVNISSTARLLDFAWRTKVKKFVYASSGGIYGSSEIAFDENSPIEAHDQLGFYLGSKLCGEVLVKNYSQLMDVTTLRFFFMYGAGQRRLMLIPRLIDSVRNATPISLQGSDGICINPIHVSDAVIALRALLKQNGSHTINIAGPSVLTLKQIAETIGDEVKRKPVFNYVDGEPTHLIGDITAMQRLLNTPQILFKNGVKDLI